MSIKRFSLFTITLLIWTSLSGQDIENISKQKPFHISGSVGANYSYTYTNDSNRIPMPSFWNVNVNLNMELYGIAIPFTAVITNGKFNIQNSFNQFGLSPKYKWITLHGGYRQYSYSPFSVSGQTFLGGGIDIHPSLFRFGAFIGRLRKAAKADTSLYSQTIPGSYPLNVTNINGTNYYSQVPAFTRWGWGLRIGAGTENNYGDLIFFKGKDRTASITDSLTESMIKPEENVLIGINTFQKIGKHVTFSFDADASVYTLNTSTDSALTGKRILLASFFKIFTPINYTTQLQTAGNISVGLNFKNFRMQTQYRRIDPNYQSMGTASTYCDNEMAQTQINWGLFKQKLRFTHTLQFQHDNLNRQKPLTSDRVVLNTSVSLNLKPQWGIDVSYNNFEMWQRKTKDSVPDSIKVSQNSNTIMLVPRYIFMTKTHTDVISFVGSFTDIGGGGTADVNNHIKNFYATLNNTLALNKSGWSVNTGLNYNVTKTLLKVLRSYGFIAGVAKSFFENKFSLNNTNTLLWNTLDGKANGNTVAIDLTGNYVLLKKHNFGCGLNYLYSPANGIYNKKDFDQFRVVVSYQYNF